MVFVWRLGGGVDRIAVLVQELAADLAEWADLRLRLIKLEVEQRLMARRRLLIAYVCLAVTGVVAFLLVMIGVSIALGFVLASVEWGFLITGAGLGLFALGTYWILRRRFTDESEGN